MANEKKIILTWAESGITIYCLVRRDADDYLLDDADGSFAVAPTDKYLSMPEDAVITGLYEVSESRTVWNNGLYLALLYKQIEGSPDLTNDILIASGEMYIWSDVEIDKETWSRYAIVVSAPPISAKACRVFEYLFNPDDNTIPIRANVTAVAKVKRLPYDYNGKLHSGVEISASFTDDYEITGVVYWDLVWEASVLFTVTNFTKDNGITKIIPLQSTARLTDI